jgi:sRNA-binding regulator protein Hfq
MLRQSIHLLIIGFLMTSCTAYRNSITMEENEVLTPQELSLVKNDKVFLISNGERFRGKIEDFSNESITVKLKLSEEERATIPYDQISKIKYDENVLLTVLKVTGTSIGGVIIIGVIDLAVNGGLYPNGASF